MRLRKNLLLHSLAYVVMAVLAAQAPGDPDWQTAAGGKMAFEVASVRLAKPGTFTVPSLPLDRGDAKPAGGRFSASVSLGRYIFFAYKLEGFQAIEMQAQLPKWANDPYAIDAKAEGNPTKDQMRLMIQSPLADRFKLGVHFETKEVPVLALTLVKPGKLGRSCFLIPRDRPALIHSRWIHRLHRFRPRRRVSRGRRNAELLPKWEPETVLGWGRGIRPWGCLPALFTILSSG